MVDKVFKAARGAFDRIVFSPAEPVFFNVYPLVFYPAFFEIPLGLFCVKALVFAENLYVLPSSSS